jgi:hypothetical protein
MFLRNASIFCKSVNVYTKKVGCGGFVKEEKVTTPRRDSRPMVEKKLKKTIGINSLF